MVEGVGHHVDSEGLERIGLYYDFKKNFLFLSFYRKRPSGNRKTAGSAGKD